MRDLGLNRSSPHWCKLAAASLLAVALAGCGGGNGNDGAAGASGAAGAAGANGVDKTALVQVSKLTTDQWANANWVGTVTGVTIAGGPPVVTFKVTDAFNNPVIGLGSTTKAATATVASYPNVAFTLAKLVPGANGSPSKWVSYNVTTPPTTTAKLLPGKPTTDSQGTLVDNGDGTYKYTFYRDPTKIKDVVAAAAADAKAASALNDVADLGDLTYDPALTHRLVLQLSGNAPGTGTNVPNAVQLVTGVPMKNPLNVVYDFIPATGKPVAATDAGRDIVKMSACYECHSKFAVHGGGRQDPRLCVTCHNDQRKYGTAEATTTATGYSGSTSRIGGKAVGDFPAFLHRLHMGAELVKTGYNYANILFNEVGYPQPITNCVKCHDGSATAKNKTTQGDNWKTVPSILACGACHDGINFATGTGTTLAGATTGHVGGKASDDKSCASASCHAASDIQTAHVTVDTTGSNGRGGYPVNTADNVPAAGFASGQGPAIPLASQLGTLPTGVYKINFELGTVTIAGAAGAHKATVVYRILKDGLPVTLNATGFLIDGVDGSPDIQITYALPQDGVTTPVDWTTSATARIIDIRDKKNNNTQTGPDANGWYTATLGATIPDAATLITGVIGIDYQGFVQLNLPSYPKGIRLREPLFVMKTATGQTVRRTVVDGAKCNACHGQLGVSPSFHSGRSNNGAGCALCHTPNNSTGHTGPASLASPDQQFGGAWSVSAKNLIHGTHGASKRENAYTYEATAANPLGLGEVKYPGVLNNCEQCHVPGSYDFSASANSAALPSLLWTTEAKTDMTNNATTNPGNLPSRGLSPWVTSLGRGQVDYRTDNLVSSPLSSACFGCHDSKAAVSHMQINGGVLYASVSAVSTGGARPATGTNTGFKFTPVEQCMVCHANGKVADIRAVHMN